MKTLQQLRFGDKVKLQLIQPKIKCSGRNEVKCFYKGKVVDEKQFNIKIEFKYKGEIIEHWYNVITDSFSEDYLKDIKIK